jgi:uncharacterized repeat protein (TIGR04138 family)
MNPNDFVDTIDRIREKDPRFRREAYVFVLAGLEHVVSRLSEPRHITGRELLDGIAELAKQQFGAMAPGVFAEWGVQSSTDIGEMVFQLVEARLLGKRPEDSLQDFADFDLPAALRAGR